jgi:processive 1,2-diacylglycerol beta-glucosyltransferase
LIRWRGASEAGAEQGRSGAGGPVLIVSASAGAGHVRAAEAVGKACAAIKVAAEHVDVLDLAPRWVRGLYGGGFRLLAEHAPGVWRGIYSMSDGPEGDTARWGPVAHRILFREFRRLLRSRPWEYCLSTHFLPTQLAARSGATRFGLVVTDFTLHRYWVQPHVREYFVGTSDLAERVRHRVGGALVEATGIPVDPVFAAVCPQASRATLGLSETDRVVLVMGGGFGLGTDESAEAALSLPDADLRVLAVCGANVDSRARLTALAESDRRLTVRGHVDDVERYMAAADVIVTKPGGLSLSEALAVGRPMVLTRPLPGHEEANAQRIAGAGAALLAHSGNEVRAALERMFDDPGLRMRMAEPVRALARPDAAANVAAILTTRLRIPVAA